MARLSGALSALVIVCGISDRKLLQVPSIAFIAFGAASVGLLSIFFCLWGLKRDSRRWRNPSFWLSLAGSCAVLIVLGAFYARLMSVNAEFRVSAVSQPPQSQDP